MEKLVIGMNHVCRSRIKTGEYDLTNFFLIREASVEWDDEPRKKKKRVAKYQYFRITHYDRLLKRPRLFTGALAWQRRRNGYQDHKPGGSVHILWDGVLL